MNRLLRLLTRSAAVALGTWLIGWPATILWGAMVGFLDPRPGPARRAALDAAVAWGLILVIMAAGGAPVAGFAVRLAGSMRIPVIGLVAATLLYPALLASCAAWIAALFRRVRDSAPADAKVPGSIMREAA